MTETTFTEVRSYSRYGMPTGRRWRCDVCRKIGYGDPHENRGRYGHWSDGCKRGHSPCVWCGRQLSVLLDGTPRVHGRCPDRPDDAELLRLAVAEARRIGRYGVRGPMGADSTALLSRLTKEPNP